MIFKANWEKAHTQHLLPEKTFEKMLQLAYPHNKLLNAQMVGDGCANLNVKVQLQDIEHPFILRIYLRDKEAVYREQKIGLLLKSRVNLPLIYYIGEYQQYCFALTEFIPGKTLRDLLLSKVSYDAEAIMYDVGVILGQIANHGFPQAGMFDKDLNVIKPIMPGDYLAYAKECLENQLVISQLNPSLIIKVNHCLDEYASLFPNGEEKCLVHADFDPANILVAPENEGWKISAVLDWEFAFSGSTLCDLANMLRYAHQMPVIYEEAFLRGLKSEKFELPENWRISVHMLNIMSLLDCLKQGDPINRPNQRADIFKLIEHIVQELEEK